MPPYPVPHDPDEPQEGDARKRHQIQGDGDAGAMPRICQPHTWPGRIGRRRDDDEDKGHAEQQREGDTRDGCGARGAKAGACDRFLVSHNAGSSLRPGAADLTLAGCQG